jgi:hypothetical protein
MRSKYSDYAKAVLLAFRLGNAHFYIAAAIHDAWLAAPLVQSAQASRDHHHGYPRYKSPACETRFYDLARERIICPSCGEEYALVVGVATSPTGKTAWRRKAVKQSKPPLSKSDRAETLPGVASDVADAPDTGHGDDDLVLEQEPDETDVTHLIEHVEEPTERK